MAELFVSIVETKARCFESYDSRVYQYVHEYAIGLKLQSHVNRQREI